MFQIIQRMALALCCCATMAGCGGSDSTTNNTPIISMSAPNEVNELDTVTLAATATDNDGSVTSYLWQQTSGSPVELSGANSERATFIAPEISNDENLQFSLTVEDNEGATTQQDFSIMLLNVNKIPTLTIQAPLAANEMTQISIVATADDIDGEVVTYHWQQVSGAEIALENTSQTSMSLLLPDVATDQTLIFSITITDNEGGTNMEQVSILVEALTMAETVHIMDQHIAENDQNISIFISALDIQIATPLLASVGFTVKQMPGSVAKPISAEYAIDKLKKIEQGIQLPIFGMYRSHVNDIELSFTFIDGSTKIVHTQIATEIYMEPEDNPFNSYEVSQRVADSAIPSYDYFVMKSNRQGPVIMDVDGNVRWQAYLKDAELYNGYSSILEQGVFKLAQANKLYSLYLDGSLSFVEINHPTLTNISAHHELSKGKTGYLVEIDANKNGVSEPIIESILLEVNDKGDVLKTWDFGEIFTAYLNENAEQANDFVRDGIDWFHMNSAIYSPEDNSLLVSSRENFVVKIDYDSSEIKWLFGDETKYWYENYPALRTLSLSSTELKPIGQHALSLVDGELLLFNDGQLSFNQPENGAAGIALDSSHSTQYSIDEETMTATISWDYDPDIYSDVCSSVYKDSANEQGDYLINYSAVNRLNADPIATIVQGITKEKELLFELKFETKGPCVAGWNSSIAYGLTEIHID